jgi:UDP-glucose 4-epimerase
MKILVTGGAGFIGSNLVSKLFNDGYDVVCLDDYSFGKKENEILGVKYYDLDIEDINKIDEKIDICFHLAAQSRVQPSFDNPGECFRINVTGTMKVLNWANLNNVKIIYAGSCSKHHDPSDSPYAMYKYLGEEICKLYRKSFNLNVEIARFYNVYGPNENIDEKFGNVIGVWLSKLYKSMPLTIVGDGNQKRDFIHVFDIVDGLTKIAFSEITHDDAWELGSGINYSINQLYEMFKTNFSATSVYVPDQPGNYRMTMRTNDDMLNKLNWLPKDRLESHIKSLKIK